MKKPKIVFLNHASFIIQQNNVKILVDPYLFGSAFNNGWNLLTEVDHSKEIKNITHIFFSHEHPDHFSVPFLQNIELNLRKKITILYQHTYDKRIKNFCEKLGYKFREFKNGVEEFIDKDLSIIIGKVPFYDSWINFKIHNINILNVNDCVLENPRLVYEIKKRLNRKIDVLFTQFSYANFIKQEKQEKKAKEQLDKIKLQDHVLNPTFIIPFASFIYFSHLENRFMNKNINSLKDAHDFISNNCKAKPIILAPNETWYLDSKNNEISLKFWRGIYSNINQLKYHSIKQYYQSNDLYIECKKYLMRLKENNNFYLILILYLFGFFPPIKLHILDLNKHYKFDIIRGLVKTKDESNNSKNISLSSENLIFVFKYDYGFDTLQVNSRLECDENYFKKVTKCFILGSLNNTGRYIKILDLYKYLNLNFILRGLEILNIKKKHH